MGIDPGFGRLGWAFIEQKKQGWTALDYGCVETSKTLPFSDRLFQIHRELKIAIDRFLPDCVAVEQLFFYKNVKTALDVGQARGVVILTCKQKGLPVYEYTPLQVKQALVGYGRAEKRQVEQMVKLVLGIGSTSRIQDDAADALAVAYTCSASLKSMDIRVV